MIDGFNTLEFGAGIAGKEANAGKIGYASFTPDALDIIGAGTNLTNRKIKFWNEGGSEFTGNIGVGTAPTFGVRLHINQDVEALRLSGNQPYMTFFNGADFKGYVRSIGADDMEMGTGAGNTNGKLNLSIRGSAFLTVQNDGKVSVNGPAGNFQSPAFTVNGNFGMKGAGGTEWTFRPLNELQVFRSGVEIAFLDDDGDWSTPSDVRLKDNFLDYKPVLTGIKNLRVCTYQYKSDKTGARSFGLIAQNVSQYFEDVVSETTDATGEKKLGIAYSKMSVLAIKAIQEQQEIIEQQQERIENLEKKIAMIEKLMAEKIK
jgi:trimeric autotransporter adhesin